jgi:enamine deaminase RidA (YjgF/YER057c/UK114 family)
MVVAASASAHGFGNGVWVVPPCRTPASIARPHEKRSDLEVARSMKQVLNPSSVPAPAGNFSHLVRLDVGDAVLLFLSGQVALDEDGNLVGEGDMARQTEQVYELIGKILAAAGAGFGDVVKLTTYLTDLAQLDAHREVRDRYLPDPPPASTLVQVAGLVQPGLLVEVEVVAAVPR